jgi:hypothetical protein
MGFLLEHSFHWQSVFEQNKSTPTGSVSIVFPINHCTHYLAELREIALKELLGNLFGDASNKYFPVFLVLGFGFSLLFRHDVFTVKLSTLDWLELTIFPSMTWGWLMTNFATSSELKVTNPKPLERPFFFRILLATTRPNYDMYSSRWCSLRLTGNPPTKILFFWLSWVSFEPLRVGFLPVFRHF